METQKTFLLAALFFLTFMLWQSWQQTFPPENITNDNVAELIGQGASNDVVPGVAQASGNSNGIVPSVQNLQNKNNDLNTESLINENDLITVRTDLVEYKINRNGGDIVRVNLLKFNKSIDDNQPLTLLNDSGEGLYIAPNGITGVNGPDTQFTRAKYYTLQDNYIVNDGDYINNQYKVDFELVDNTNGLKVTKSFIFNKSSYDIDVKYTITNNSNQNWNGNLFSVLKRKADKSKSSSFISPTGYSGLAAYNTEDKFHKINPEKLSESKSWNSKEGWAAVMQHYFISAWIPDAAADYKYIAKTNNDNTYMVTLVSPSINVKPGNTEVRSIKFYAGPEQAKELGKLATGLNRTVDYGIMWPIASLIFMVMSKIYDFVGNWGIAIIGITILIKLLFYRLSSSSYKSMAKLKVLAPKIETLRKRYGEDKEKMGKAMMELYKKEKVNPLGGCLPMLIQVPFFIALYWVIIESVELRQAPFIFWIQDLSVKDPYYVLPLLMVASMFAQQKLSPAPADPTQEKVMMLMPIMFGALFMYFPAGLVLYWVINTVASILQQWWIMRTVDVAKSKK